MPSTPVPRNNNASQATAAATYAVVAQAAVPTAADAFWMSMHDGWRGCDGGVAMVADASVLRSPKGLLQSASVGNSCWDCCPRPPDEHCCGRRRRADAGTDSIKSPREPGSG